MKQHNAYGATFWEIGEHAPIAGILNGVKALRDSGADFIVSVGGSSPIDASKAIIYKQQEELGGPFIKQIAIPTTISAAEYTVSQCITFPIKRHYTSLPFRLERVIRMSMDRRVLYPHQN